MALMRWNRWWRVLVAIVIVMVVGGCDAPPLPLSTAPPSSALSRNRIIGPPRVIDADTLEIEDRRLTLWGVDAPELEQTCTRGDGDVWPCGAEAAKALSDWLNARTLNCQPRGGKGDPLVAICRVNGKDVGEWLVSTGWAVGYPITSRGYYRQFEYVAARRRLGLHQGEFELPWEFRSRRRQSEQSRVSPR